MKMEIALGKMRFDVFTKAKRLGLKSPTFAKAMVGREG
jgi:hypothetical protein